MFSILRSHHHDDESISEQLYTPLNDELVSEKYGRNSKECSTCQWRLFLLPFLAGSLTSVIILLLGGVVYNQFMLPASRAHASNSFVPEISTTTVIWDGDAQFDGPSKASNEVWDSMMPDSRGYVIVDDPAKYNLKQGLLTPTGHQTFSLSVFHQLHCLGAIRDEFWKDPAIVNQRTVEVQNDVTGHMNHCFDYVRQALKCGADTTLEWDLLDEHGRSKGGAGGWGIPHQCADWDAVVDFAEKHQYQGGKVKIGIA